MTILVPPSSLRLSFDPTEGWPDDPQAYFTRMYSDSSSRPMVCDDLVVMYNLVVAIAAYLEIPLIEVYRGWRIGTETHNGVDCTYYTASNPEGVHSAGGEVVG